jgi:HKD family nuclease
MSITHNVAASSARHSTHHRGDAVADETTDLLSVLADRLRHCESIDVSVAYALWPSA